MNSGSVEIVKKKGLRVVMSLRKNNGWLAIFVPFALGMAFADIAAVPVALICYKGAMSLKPNSFIYAICALVGIMFGGNLTAVIMALLAVLAAITSNMFLSSGEDSLTTNCIHGAVVATVLMLIGYALNGLSIEKIAYAFFYGLATYFGIYAFKKAGEGMGLGKKRITSDDGALFTGCVIMACLMCVPEFSLDFFGVENFAFNIRTIACVVYMFYTVRKCRVSGAVAISAIGGLLLGISKNDLMAATLYATDFAIVALLSGVFSVYGYKVTMITFLFSLNIISLFAQGAVASFTWSEIAVIAVLCVLCEWLRNKGVFFKHEPISIGENTANMKADAMLDGNIKVNGIASEKFDKLAECIQNIGEIVATNIDRDNMRSKTYTMSYNLNRIAKNVCSRCACRAFCWEQSQCETSRAIMDMVDACSKNGSGRCSAKDAPEKFRGRCGNLPLVLEEINVMAECARQEKLSDLRLKESQDCMKEQLVGLANMVSQMADELKYNVDRNILSEFAIEEEVGRAFGEAEVSIVTDAKGRNEVEVIPLDGTQNRFTWDEKELAGIVSNMLDKKMVSTGVKLNSNLTVAARFVEKTKYKVVAGVAATNKSGKQISGDSFISEKIGNSKFLCGLSDGMGAGANASGYSDVSVNLLKNLVDADVSLENAVDMVNRMNAFKNSGEGFATLDACFVDLYDGDVSFVKAGGAPSFLVTQNGAKVEMIGTGKLPLGLERSHTFDILNTKLRGGDCVILMSDGVYERLCEAAASGCKVGVCEFGPSSDRTGVCEFGPSSDRTGVCRVAGTNSKRLGLVKKERVEESEGNNVKNAQEIYLCELISALVRSNGSVDVKNAANKILNIAIENCAGAIVGTTVGTTVGTAGRLVGKAAGAENLSYSEKSFRDISDDMTVMFLKLWQKY